MTSVHILPKFRNGADHGGIKRVVDAQLRHLASYDIEVVDNSEAANVLGMHATSWVEPTDEQIGVVHCHGLYWSNYEWPRWSLKVNEEITRNMYKATIVTAPSEWVANAIRRMTGLQVQVIGHGIELDEWSPLPHNNYVLWDKTRADPVCDPRPVNVLARMLPKIKFLTSIGEQTGNVDIIGIQSYNDHKPFMQHAMLYLCTARETFGIGTLEAMACGVPIVGWNWGGQTDIVEHKKTGWLAPVGDYENLTEGIRYCIEHREEMSVQCREVIELKFQWRDVIGQYAALYKQQHSTPQYKVSVVMPSHNLSDYLPKAIESVLKQDYKNYELVIVDDHSTDNSLEIAQRYANNNVRVIQTPSNLYLAGALNYGIEHSQGEYILPLDADNTIPPGTLSVLATELDRQPNTDIAYGRVRFINEDGSPYQSQITDEQGISRWPPTAFSYDRQMNHHNQIPSTSMYRRKVWSRIGGYRRRCRTAEDADFWCRATTFGAIPQQVTQAITLTYTNRNDSMSHSQADWPWEYWTNNVKRSDPYVPTASVSIVIPVGPGHGELVVDALDSVMNQTFRDWECIVVDDTNGEIKWLPSWVRYFKTDSASSGVSVARNIGIDNSIGHTFVLLDADDYLSHNALDLMYSAYRQHGGYIYSDWYKSETRSGISIKDYSCAAMHDMLQHPITCMYPREVRDYARFDPNLRYGEDWDYLLQVLHAGWCGTYISEPLMYYRQGSGSNRQTLKDNITEVKQLMKERYDVAGCGCSKGGGVQVTSPVPVGASNNDMVLLEYTGEGGAITYKGHATSTNYRFGADNGHRLKYVHASDAEYLLNRTEFKLANMATVS